MEAAFAAHPGAIAAVILEPVVGNAGCIAPAEGYLAGLRALTTRHGALLIVDEVMTGFRVALGGAVRAVRHRSRSGDAGKDCGRRPAGGRLWRKARVDGFGFAAGAGVSGGNVERESAGHGRGDGDGRISAGACRRGVSELEDTAKAVAEGVAAEAAKANVALTLNRVGSMFTWFFTPGPVTNYTQAAFSDTAIFGNFHRAMLDEGVWLPPSQFEAAFV